MGQRLELNCCLGRLVVGIKYYQSRRDLRFMFSFLLTYLSFSPEYSEGQLRMEDGLGMVTQLVMKGRKEAIEIPSFGHFQRTEETYCGYWLLLDVFLLEGLKGVYTFQHIRNNFFQGLLYADSDLILIFNHSDAYYLIPLSSENIAWGEGHWTWI